MRIVLYSFLAIALLFCSSCHFFQEQTEDKIVARAFDKYLHASDISNVIAEGTNAKDSAVLARRFIDTWVKNQLMLHRAELAFEDEQIDIKKQIEEYRSSLFIYTYRQQLLQQKMDTLVSSEEISAYYENNLANFVLNTCAVKARFVKVPLDGPEISNVRLWTRSTKEEDLDKLEKYCINYADKFDTFNNDWVYFSQISEQIPIEITNPARYLRYNKNIEARDSLFHYFAHISEYKVEGDPIPLYLIQHDIESILLNKRKIEFYNDLEKQVFNEGVNRNQFEIY